MKRAIECLSQYGNDAETFGRGSDKRRGEKKRKGGKRLLLGLVESSGHIVKIDDFPPFIYVLRPVVLVDEIVCMLPYVES